MYDQENKNIRQGLKSPPSGGTRFNGLSRPDRGNFKGIKTPGKSGAAAPREVRSAMTWGGKSAPSKSNRKFVPFKDSDGQYTQGLKSPKKS